MDARTVSDALGEWMAAEAVGRVCDRLALALTHAIDAGLLTAGTRLPPERELATALAVSRPTLRAALTDLRARGLIGAVQGSGTWIATRSDRRAGSFAEAVVGDAAVNLSASVPWDARALVACGVRLTSREFLGLRPADGYGPGLIELQEQLAERAGAQGRPTEVSNVVIAPGAQRALHATLEFLGSPGERILVEREAYPGTFDICEALHLVPVPVDFHDPDAIDRALARRPAAAALLQPIVNNPTGTGLSDAAIAGLAKVFDRRGLPVVENDVLAELRFDDHAPPGLAQRCRLAPVLAIGSFSKTIWGGLRVGWINGPEPLVREIRRRIHRTELGMSAPSQLLASQVLRGIDPVLQRRRRELAESAALVQRRLARDLPRWTVTEPIGGSSLWVRLPVRDASPFVKRAAECGVDVLPGALALAGRQRSGHIRLSFDRPPPMLEEGIGRLAAAWATFTDLAD